MGSGGRGVGGEWWVGGGAKTFGRLLTGGGDFRIIEGGSKKFG